MAPIFILLSDAAQAALVATFAALAHANMDVMFTANEELEATLDSAPTGWKFLIQELRSKVMEHFDATLANNLQATSNRILVALASVLTLWHTLARLAKTEEFVPPLNAISDSFEKLLRERAVK
jgi:hypothetical protein